MFCIELSYYNQKISKSVSPSPCTESSLVPCRLSNMFVAIGKEKGNRGREGVGGSEGRVLWGKGCWEGIRNTEYGNFIQ